jgi:hypothetical protein
MADRRMDSPDQRDDVSEVIHDILTRIDVTSIAKAIIDDRTIGDCIDSSSLCTYDLVDVLSWAIPDAINRDSIADAILTSSRDVRSSSEPDPPQPSSMVDATMLREQILGTIVSIIHSPCGYRSRNQLTNLPANAKVLHNLYQHASPAAAKYAEADVIVASHRIGTFSAHLVRTRTDQAGLAVTLEVRGWKTHVEALEALFNLSRDRLSRAFEASEDMGGKLGNWELLDLK